jgi:glyoxylase-like metal-dependent hydrolase (beta-lactamase superfamily II)
MFDNVYAIQHRILGILLLAGMVAGLSVANGPAAFAFGHDKFQRELRELTRPRSEQPPPAQPAAKPAPAPAPVAAPKPQPRKPMVKRSIQRIAGDVFQFKNNFHNSVFMVTPDGIVLVDPINREASSWLKAELWRRFNQPVKYVIYSHDHADHISGGEVFADSAIFVSHDQAKRDIITERRPTPVPDITFTDRLTLELGGKQVELSYVGRNHSDNSVVVNFPAERVLHAVDFIPVQAVAFKDLPDAYVDDWIDSLKKVEAMDFDVLSPGHGRIGVKRDVRAYRGYMEQLRNRVSELARAGRTVDEVVARVTMDRYRSWSGYDRFVEPNVRAMYDRVQLHRRDNPRPRR